MKRYELPDLPYDYGALEPHVSGEILGLHHDTHHGGYVKKANAALDELAEMRSSGDYGRISMLEKDLAFNLSGHILHSILWTNLQPQGGGRPDGELLAAIEEDFGSFERFEGQLTAATTGVQGSGWGVLAWEPRAERLVVEQVYDHQTNVAQSSEPLLVFDAWEHAFYLQYHNDKDAYVKGLWQLINWDDVTSRFDAARDVARV